MDSYQEKLAPIFSQIILQKEFEQLQILREAYERFRSRPYALPNLKHDYVTFDQAAREFSELCVAHERLRSNTYGKCSVCGNNIDLRRLNVYPATLHCLSCEPKVNHPIPLTELNCI
ncbi:TraR/DksA C4-type zinc finger protein [Rhodoferax lacus]|uniref:TraR/DksA C4-type zinc finger protein n=1 Tax=Rhodoferax lacus TaxID=2184758 RepID=UPI0013149DA6